MDIKPENLDKLIYGTCNVLAILLHRIHSQFNIEEHLRKVREDISVKKINAKKMAEEIDSTIFPDRSPPYRVHFSHACIYTGLAMDSKENDRELDSWAFIAQARYHAGLAMAGISTYLGVDPEAVLADRAKKGGEAKAASYKLDQDEVMRILSSPPVDGWCSEEQAIGIVKELLSKKIKENLRAKDAQRFKLDPEDPKDFERKIRGWIKLDKARQREGKRQRLVRLVYERYSREVLMFPHEGHEE